MAELFAPTEAELDQMIRETQQAMEAVDNKAEYDKLHNQLRDLREQKRQLIILNNTI